MLDEPLDEEDVEVDVELLVDPDDADDVLLDTFPLDDEEVDDDTSPLDDAEEVTLPLEDDETFPLDEDETLPLLPPEADDVLLVLDTPPVLVDDPPEEVDEDDAPDEVEEPPDEVEVDPPLVLDVEETTIPLDPPPDPPPPKKPPAKNPPPMPPPPVPPTSTGPPPNPPPDTGGISAPVKAGGSGTGAAWLATVTTVGGHTVLVRVTTRVTTRVGAGRGAARLEMARLVIARLVMVRFCADSATCTAPPPMTAPPQAHAHSFANAILTDMPHHSSPRTSMRSVAAAYRTVLHHQGETNRKAQTRLSVTNTHIAQSCPMPADPCGSRTVKGRGPIQEPIRFAPVDTG